MTNMGIVEYQYQYTYKVSLRYLANNERDRPHVLTTTTTTGIIGKPKPDNFKIPSPIGGRDNWATVVPELKRWLDMLRTRYIDSIEPEE